MKEAAILLRIFFLVILSLWSGFSTGFMLAFGQSYHSSSSPIPTSLAGTPESSGTTSGTIIGSGDAVLAATVDVMSLHPAGAIAAGANGGTKPMGKEV